MLDSQDDVLYFAYPISLKPNKQTLALFKSEERYRGLLNNLDAGILVHAVDIDH
jgi:hypothetical protein